MLNTKADESPKSEKIQQASPKQADKPKDHTVNWKTISSISNTFIFRVPDGWELYNYPGGTVNGNGIVYKPGTAAIIHEESQAYAGDQKAFNVTLTNQAYDAPQWQSPNSNGKETVSEYSIGSLKGKKYSIEWLESLTGVNKGDKIYQYVFNLEKGRQLNVVYKQSIAETNNLKTVEQVIQTINVK